EIELRHADRGQEREGGRARAVPWRDLASDRVEQRRRDDSAEDREEPGRGRRERDLESAQDSPVRPPCGGGERLAVGIRVAGANVVQPDLSVAEEEGPGGESGQKPAPWKKQKPCRPRGPPEQGIARRTAGRVLA